jgi:hypothetical protein
MLDKCQINIFDRSDIKNAALKNRQNKNSILVVIFISMVTLEYSKEYFIEE